MWQSPSSLRWTAWTVAFFMIVYGYRMWWQRRPTRGFGPPYPRGGWRRVRWSVLAALAVCAAAVGVFLPLFGISLAAFLLLDVLFERRSRSRVG
jgi:uncharacterized iron-regulated membrane protein